MKSVLCYIMCEPTMGLKFGSGALYLLACHTVGLVRDITKRH